MGTVAVAVAVALPGEVPLDELHAAEVLVSGVDARVQHRHRDVAPDVRTLQGAGDEDAPGGVVHGRGRARRLAFREGGDEAYRDRPGDACHLAVVA
jgi:hypothetical protein